MALGFGFSNQSQQAQSSGSGNSFISGMQSPFLSSLWQGATNLAGGQQGIQGQAQNMVGQMLPGTFDALGSMGNIAQGNSPLAQFANPNNQLVSQQLGMLGQSLGDMFTNTIAPTMGSAANMAGGLGASRHQLGLGQAAGDIGKAFMSGGVDLASNAYNTAANSANALTQSMMGAGSAIPGMSADIFNLGMSPMNAAWSPFQNLAGILGGPTVLQQNQQQMTSSGKQNQFKLGF